MSESALGAVSGSSVIACNYASVIACNYVRVNGDTVVSSGITEEITQTKNGVVQAKYASAEFMVLRVGSSLLVVKANPGAQATQYVGTLTSLPEDVRAQIFNGLEVDIQQAFLPLMVDASEPYDEGLVPTALVLAIVFVVAVFNLLWVNHRSVDLSRHPLAKSIAKFGHLEELVPQIDAEIIGGAAIFSSSIYVTKSWFINCGANSVMRKEEIVWIYKKQTSHSVNFIPTGTTYSSVIRDARGGALEISGAEQQVQGLLTGLLDSMPWIMGGYSDELEKLYKKQRAAFVLAVVERRQAALKAVAASTK